ncbi:MerR family transcriptional regulator [Paenibacillus hamazuiensis]|uniref:MerR family transcriptional regulator n=1 Tax=Paenibacillus hamazuiensis TaxID=2936508 RepID=UPI00200E33CA|nr:MerR family transcriptional regulator [Paenibacillus hamazuiensis]
MHSEHEQLFTVGELARKCGVTVRTLQYYDKSGLLCPSGYSEGGRRLYSRRDIIRLQQILFLKSMGFSLEEISQKVLPADSAAELTQVFKNQKTILARQLAQIQQTIARLDKIMEEIQSGNEVGIEKLLMITRASRSDNPYFFLPRHMSKEQIEYFIQRFDEDGTSDFNKKLLEFSAKLIDLHGRNEKPEGAEGQQLAEMWWNLVMLKTKGDLSLIHDIGSVIINENNWPQDAADLKDATLTFLRKAVLTYLRKNNIKLPKNHGGIDK